MKKEKQFHANLFVGRDQICLGESLIIIRYEDTVPESVECYFKPTDETYLEAIHQRLDFSLLKFSTEPSEFIIKTKDTNSSIRREEWRANKLQAKIRELVEYRLLNEKFEKVPANDTVRIYITLPYLDFLEDNLSCYKSESSFNLKELKELDEKYRIDLPVDGFTKSYYVPGLFSVESNSRNQYQLKYQHAFVFELDSDKGNRDLLKEIVTRVELLLRIINMFSREKVKIDHIILRRRFDGKPYKIQIKRNVRLRSKDDSHIAISGKEFLALVFNIYSVVRSMEHEAFDLFHVITWRLLKIRKQSDLSIEIAILHVVLQMLLEYLNEKEIRIREIDRIRELLERRDISVSEETMENLAKFNKYRNRAFKNISKFSLDPEFIDVRNSAIKILALVFARFLKIDKENLNTFTTIFERIYTFNVIFAKPIEV